MDVNILQECLRLNSCSSSQIAPSLLGDVLNRASFKTASTGAHTVFALTTPSFGPNGLKVEYNGGKTIADVATEEGAEYIIFNTLPSAGEISGGKYTKVTPFDAKAKAEQ